ncbi:Fic family protein [Sedimentibacter sp. MB31-C6]|uniref:Fic family protein n=1 Tax=Sedimentibacter sp. MB31-C6 TaxID=3109366 RepID=UPI002DDD7610|nr:Fic/DOC family N-terminal domain-containing protein [Sedimentibacter sp. MB36-C1]WSI05395.1 Fic/DOC family N-terminal domain-containing protein [Sedimentibacter sp. MB36-C1]
MSNLLQDLPPNVELETKHVLKQVARSHRALAELKGFADMIPNKNILINAITINEAKDSSEIENIITTHDELFKAMSGENYKSPAAKEVVNYRTAIWHGYKLVKENDFLSTNMIIEIQRLIESNQAGIRKLPGTVLKNEVTGEVVYTPPSGELEILSLLSNLEQYINNDYDNIDSLVKLAIIHYQFESIHPFYDGNGRTGRIVNVLYLVLKELLDSPILYLSKFIIRNKSAYYRLLQEVTVQGKWEDWVLFILQGIEETANETLMLVKEINGLLENTAEKIKNELPKIYSRELVELIFFEFYTKISYIEDGLDISRKTAAKYLSDLEKEGFLASQKIGRERIYLNRELFRIVKDAGAKK